ncbi:MAG: protein TolB, partial [Desulfobulbaceae bacterium]|nr:protein TolB [Desulfobulbaceae bacterium]
MKLTEKLLRSTFLFLLLSFIASSVHAERVYLDITASDVRKVVVAVPDFTGSVSAGEAAGQGRKIAQLLSRGLEFHGFITVLDQKRYGGSRDTDWKAFDVDYVVMGLFDAAESAMKVEGRLLDVAEDRMLAGRRYKGTAKQQDDMVLRLCDALIEEFSGEPGISRTSLAYVSDATGRKEVYISDVLG